MEFKLPGVGVGVGELPPPSPAQADINKERTTTPQHPAARRYNMEHSWAPQPYADTRKA